MRLQDIKNIGHFFKSTLAIALYRYPAKKLKVVGVTGTDGKTTVVNLIYHILKTAGKKVGMISTVGARINSEQLITTGLHTTTPSPFLIQKLLKNMVDNDCEYAVIEVTSHSLDQHRVLGCNFLVGVLTNISHEHLDYHQTMKHYLKTKLKLFKNVKFGVINNDDINLKSQISNLKAKSKNLKLYTFGIKNELPRSKLRGILAGSASTFLTPSSVQQAGRFSAIKNEADLMAKDIEFNDRRMSFNLYSRMHTRIQELRKGYKNAPNIDGSGKSIETTLIGEFNVYNILAAICVAKIFGINDEIIKKAIASFKSVKGRMEEVKLGQPFSVFIDFGHTPQAFEATLPTVRKLTKGKIIHVFGATGKRDKTKRAIMGEVSGRLSDFIILTTEDTYGEDETEIIRALEKGVKKSGKKLNINYWIEPNRQKAINKAVVLALKNDTVVLSGVGHQQTINKGDKEIPWSEHEAVKKAINFKAKIT